MRILVCLLICLPLAACTAASYHPVENRAPAAEVPDFPQLTFAKLLEISKQSPTVEDALKILHDKYPAYLLTHTLVYDSFSIQHSTFQEPRALIFGPRAKFIFSFNGDAKYDGGASFETMEFDEDQGIFLFREIAFKKQIRPDDLGTYDADLVDSQNQNVIWTKANQTRCTQCHGDSPSPIWDVYFIWPGVYGSDDDFLTTAFVREEINQNPNYAAFHLTDKYAISLGREIMLQPGVKDVEVEGFKGYIGKKHDHPRYKWLPDRGLDKAYFRLLAGEKPSTIDVSADVRQDIETGAPGNVTGEYGRPNLNLSDLFYTLTSKKFLKAMAKNDKVKLLPLKLATLELCSGDYTEYGAGSSSLTLQNYINHWDRDPLADVKGILTDAEVGAIRQKSGAWKPFYTKFLLNELAVEAEKITRLENSFGANTIISTNQPSGSIESRPTPEFFKYLGHEVSRVEKLVCAMETDSLYQEARRDYVARGFGIDITQYVTNLRRAPTFREGGFQQSALTIAMQAGSPQFGSIEQNCAALKSALAAASK